ncbi:MAG: 16S rRNA (guanine(966)-N(2))-methyltransferase RsmD [Nitrospirae bacterium]|jgi:16S rRNA (guanine966-N2)-methyltransferase|nr:16S rRNA (guanine(966)-N(2))-methyltransferase RsmD [Nitrospirota bacterium]
MRISGGIVKGRRTATQKLLKKTSTIERLRPTSSKVREAIFDILRNKIEGSRFVDLYAGTGTVGFEALSRGSSRAVFVEMDKLLVEEIKKNICKFGFEEKAQVINTTAEEFLKKAFVIKEIFDIFFVDPPYYSEEIEKVLPLIGEKGLLNENGLIIVEHFFKKRVTENLDNLKIHRSYRYGDTMLTFYKRKDI